MEAVCTPTKDHKGPDGLFAHSVSWVHRVLLLCTHTFNNSEIERLELMIAETKNSIEKYKGQGVSTDTQRKKVLRGLEEQLSITEVSISETFLWFKSATLCNALSLDLALAHHLSWSRV